MMEIEYRKTATIKAIQWFKDGDHPAVVPNYEGGPCGWINTLEGGHIVTPGDWIATGAQGEHWPIKPDIFAATYEPVSAPVPTGNAEIDEQAMQVWQAACGSHEDAANDAAIRENSLRDCVIAGDQAAASIIAQALAAARIEGGERVKEAAEELFREYGWFNVSNRLNVKEIVNG